MKEIFTYYEEIVSRRIATKIKNNILNSVIILETFPLMGTIEELLKDKGNYRYFIQSNYKIIYRVDENECIIIDIFDTRQNPEKISKFVE